MKKGSKSRKGYFCGEIVMWWIPTGEAGLFGETIYETKALPNFATYKNHYCCKKCKEIAERNE